MIRQAQGLSERRACRLVGMARTSCRYEPQRQGQEENLKARLRTLAGERRRFGYRRLKHIVADLTLDNQALKTVLAKKF